MVITIMIIMIVVLTRIIMIRRMGVIMILIVIITILIILIMMRIIIKPNNRDYSLLLSLRLHLTIVQPMCLFSIYGLIQYRVVYQVLRVLL